METHRYLWALLLLQPTSLLGGEMIYQGLPEGAARITEDRQGRIYVAVFGTDGVVVRNDDSGPRLWQQGGIEGLEIAPQGDVWLVHDSRILRFGDDREGEVHPMDRTASFQPRNKPGPLFASRWGDLWAAGCRAMLRRDAIFVPSPLDPGTGWEMETACDDPFGNVWALGGGPQGTRQDLAVLTRDQLHRWELVGLPEERAAERWYGPCADDVGFVWLASEAALLRVDPRSDAPGQRVIARPGAGKITAIARVANRQIAVGFSDGSVLELTVEGSLAPRWQSVTTLDSGPVRAMLHDRRGRLWAVSGGNLYCSESLRAEWHRHWDEQPRMPAGNHDNIFARIGNKLYTAGGKTYFGWPASRWVNLDHVWSYDIDRGTWQIEPPMLEPGKAYPGIAALGNELWIIGGNFREGEGTRATRTVEIYDPRSRRYRLGPPLEQPRDQIVALTIKDRLYAIGGGGDNEASNEMVSIAVGETHWKREPPAPGPIFQASGCVVAGKIYLAAGPSSKCPGLFVYDPQERTWDQVKHPLAPAPGAPLCAGLGDRVWVMGGRGDNRGLVATYAYSPRTRQWQKGPDLPLPLSWGAAAEVNGRLLIAGGAYHDAMADDYFNSDRAFLLRRP